eukprot:6199010-Pleurochrysis_carterae.AAC.2
MSHAAHHFAVVVAAQQPQVVAATRRVRHEHDRIAPARLGPCGCVEFHGRFRRERGKARAKRRQLPPRDRVKSPRQRERDRGWLWPEDKTTIDFDCSLREQT